MADLDTFDQALVNRDLVVLRRIDLDKIDPVTYALAGNAIVEYKTNERSLVWFRDGFVLNDQPRDYEVTKELIAATIDFAVGVPASGMIRAEHLTLKQAEKAIRGAKTRLDIEYDLDIPEEEDVELGAEVKVVRTKKSIATAGAE